MCQEEINIRINLCGMKAGDKASLPPYLLRLNGKHFSERIKYKITKSQVCNTGYYDGHRIALPATILKTKKIGIISQNTHILPTAPPRRG